MGYVLAVVFISKTAVPVGSVVFRVDTAHFRNDAFILLPSEAFLAVPPFVIAGTAQAENFAEELYGVTFF